jgi:enterochelin esterase-like enzyme
MIMMRSLFLVSVITLLSSCSKPELPSVEYGRLERIENFESTYVTSRNIDIWLPDGYTETEKYAVLYMHDGQMLYDSTKTWNNQAWDVDDVAGVLQQSGETRKFIVVGIWNGQNTRHSDYFPEKALNFLNTTQQDTLRAQLTRVGYDKGALNLNADNYLRFMVEELKPYIDSTYSVFTEKDNTFVMGSSMGGLISMYALCEYPDVFGGAAALSTHWIGATQFDHNPIPDAFLSYLEANLPAIGGNKIYFDTGDQELDSFYPATQARVDEIMQQKGYTSDFWVTRYFPGKGHNELAWKERLHIPLKFLLAK